MDKRIKEAVKNGAGNAGLIAVGASVWAKRAAVRLGVKVLKAVGETALEEGQTAWKGYQERKSEAEARVKAWQDKLESLEPCTPEWKEVIQEMHEDLPLIKRWLAKKSRAGLAKQAAQAEREPRVRRLKEQLATLEKGSEEWIQVTEEIIEALDN